jgi:hypothetical protein
MKEKSENSHKCPALADKDKNQNYTMENFR